jgi:uncharacterized protein (DUF433 family)
MTVHTAYTFLEPRPRSHYRQLWVKGRHLRAEVLYRLTVGAEARTPEEVAHDYDLPVEAVHEAIAYARHHQELLEAERAREATRLQQLGLHRPPYIPMDQPTSA